MFAQSIKVTVMQIENALINDRLSVSTWLKEKKIISCDDQIVKTFSEYFVYIPNLNMSSHGYRCPNSLEPDPILRITDKYRDDSSIKLIKTKSNSRAFNFIQINIEEIKKSKISKS